ncbi:MAG: hypothetical protein E7157_04575 [Lactobacillales bacterium]|nr:hypothetical protein [Lactobacillales bacterium]
MSKYYLIQNGKTKDDYIDIKRIEDGAYDSTDLKDIISITSKFKCEDDLKEVLLYYSLIKNDDFNKKLKIVYQSKGKEKTLRYGVTYEDDIKLFSEVEIKRFLYQNRDNYELLERLCNHYRNSYNQQLNLDIISSYIRYFTMRDEEEFSFSDSNQITREYEKAIESFVFRELYQYNRYTKEKKEKYRGLRDLAMFLSYQSKKQKKELDIEQKKSEEKNVLIEETDFIEQHRNEKEEFLTSEDYKNIPDYDSLHGTIKEEDSDNENKIKKKIIHIPGQLTFKDMGW